MRLRELRAEARESLKGNYLKIIWPFFIAFLISFACSFLFQNFITQGNFDGAGYLVTTIIYSILVTAISIPLWYGIIISVIKVARKEEVNFLSDTFANYKIAYNIFWNMLIKLFPFYMLLIVSAIVYFGGLSFLNNVSDAYAPLVGIGFIMYVTSAIILMIKAIQYTFVYFLKYDYNTKETKELLEKSKMLMKGNIAKMFVMPYTFIGWFILAMIPCGIVNAIIIKNWAPIVQGNQYISTAPLWAQGIQGLVMAFAISFVLAYIQMTTYYFYMEQNPLNIYEEGYIKPETNSKKYILILSAIFGAALILFIIGMIILIQSAAVLNNLPPIY